MGWPEAPSDEKPSLSSSYWCGCPAASAPPPLPLLENKAAGVRGHHCSLLPCSARKHCPRLSWAHVPSSAGSVPGPGLKSRQQAGLMERLVGTGLVPCRWKLHRKDPCAGPPPNPQDARAPLSHATFALAPGLQVGRVDKAQPSREGDSFPILGSGRLRLWKVHPLISSSLGSAFAWGWGGGYSGQPSGRGPCGISRKGTWTPVAIESTTDGGP